MAYTAPTTRATTNFITASIWNTDVVDNISFLANPPHCAVRHNATQSHGTTTVWQAVLFNTEDEKTTGSMHSTVTNTSRITVPVTGLYLVHAMLAFVASASGSTRAIGLRKNGTGTGAPNMRGRSQNSHSGMSGSVPFNLWFSTTVKLTAADYIEVVAFQDTGGALNIGANTSEMMPFFSATWMGLG